MPRAYYSITAIRASISKNNYTAKELANIDITSDLGKQKAAEFDSAVESFNKYGKAIENIIKKSEEMKTKLVISLVRSLMALILATKQAEEVN